MHGVIFDMDGVLILTADAHFQSWRDTARRHGVAVDYDKFIRTFGRTNPDIIRLWWGDDVAPERLATIADEKEGAFRDIIRHEVPLAPGCRELLESLAGAGFALAVGSSAPPENIDLVLDAADIRRFFAAVVDGSMVKRGKPAPDVFLMAAENLGLEPRACAVIEDAPAGIKAAVAAGTMAVGVAATHAARELTDAGAHVVSPALRDLSAALLRDLIRSRNT
jgi:beta-phosphoglucomutase family hydrolase